MSTPKNRNKEEQISHKVLGMTGREEPETCGRKTFCDLCGFTIAIGDSMFSLEGDNLWKFRIHVNCTIALMTRLHNKTFREEVKVKPKTRKTREQKKHEFIGEGNEYCAFCSELIKEGELYSKVKKKRFHAGTGNHTCYKRYQKVMNSVKGSLW